MHSGKEMSSSGFKSSKIFAINGEIQLNFSLL